MSAVTVNYHYLDVGRDFAYHDKSRSLFQKIYAEHLLAEPALGGRVLDVGCGHGVNPTLKQLAGKLGPLDGVDPFPVEEPPQHLVNRWTCPLEEIPVPADTYDMAYSYNVVEHVENVGSFLQKLSQIVKPGAVYWSISPNAAHPFTWVTRLAQVLRLKKIYQRKLNQKANDYPAYYRLSNDKNILNAIDTLKLPIAQVDFYYLPNVQWDTYFPKPFRPIAHMIDRWFLLKNPARSFLFMFRLTKQAQV
jgi:2-polyprenyl-3-methyl-5-hydroxy-6-metoxy-1,4-benzoquinol methylase